MKTTLILLMAFVFTTVGGCDHEDIIDYGLDGQWNLTHIGGGIAGVNISVNPGTIIWVFDENNSTVTIENNAENGYSFPSGTYPYQIEMVDDHIGITINGAAYGSIEISQNQIQIDQRVADGILLVLTK